MRSIAQLLLLPLSVLYQLLTSLRNILYDQKLLSSYKSTLPVLCVGNVTVGGNGKSPLVAYLSELLRNQYGKSPVILSRGYGGTLSGPHLVNAVTDVASVVGDEPLMLARSTKMPVVVCRSRVTGAQFIEQQRLGDLIVLDDGYQHRALTRDCNLLCVAARTEDELRRCFNGSLLPAGRLRETVAQALGRADAVILQSRAPNAPVTIPEDVIKLFPQLASLPIIQTQLGDAFLTDASSGAQAAPPSDVVVVTAVENPTGVIDAVTALGSTVLEHVVLSDHSSALEATVQEMRERYPNVPIVVTLKDAVKIAGEKAGVLVLQGPLLILEQSRLDAIFRESLPFFREDR